MTNGVNFNGYGYGYNTMYPTQYVYPSVEGYGVYKAVEEGTDSVLTGAGSFALFQGAIGISNAIKAQKTSVETVEKTFWQKLGSIFKKETYAAKWESTKETGTVLKNMGKEYATSVKTSVKTGVETLKTTSATDVIKNTVQKGATSVRIQAAEGVIPNAEKIAKAVSKAPNEATGRLIKNDYEIATKWVERAKNAKTPELSSKCMNVAEKHIAEANASSAKTIIGKTAGNLATKSPTLAKIGTAFKASGAKGMAILDGIIETVTEVIPTFIKLGAKSGLKQIGKSAVKVGAGACGWAGGWAIGAAIGSIIPGAGTAVGAVVGGIISTIGGLIGSNLAKKGTEKLVGKNELELAAEEEQEQAQQAQQQQVAFQQQQMAALQQQQQALSQVSYSSNPFCSSGNIMDKDIMGVMSGYVI